MFWRTNGYHSGILYLFIITLIYFSIELHNFLSELYVCYSVCLHVHQFMFILFNILLYTLLFCEHIRRESVSCWLCMIQWPIEMKYIEIDPDMMQCILDRSKHLLWIYDLNFHHKYSSFRFIKTHEKHTVNWFMIKDIFIIQVYIIKALSISMTLFHCHYVFSLLNEG